VEQAQYVAWAGYGLMVVGALVAMMARPKRAAYLVPAILYGIHGVLFYSDVKWLWAPGTDLLFNWSAALRIHGVATVIILVLAVCLIPQLTIVEDRE